uniref:NADH-ubiquinone oxidoreductase chain 4L n=1 Tax=Osborniella crotophagae TaxID=1912107 RepID=A0A7T1M870_9NEOP|nr:NADH dehydrogenase subunit 4L [Osborniella crotophagae]
MSVMHMLLVFFLYMMIIKMLMSEKMISILMSIEFMMLSIFFLLYSYHTLWFANSILCLIFLTFMVCESVMGLSIYIYITRMSGSDQFKSLNLLKY